MGKTVGSMRRRSISIGRRSKTVGRRSHIYGKTFHFNRKTVGTKEQPSDGRSEYDFFIKAIYCNSGKKAKKSVDR